jgi:hypothetical protein
MDTTAILKPDASSRRPANDVMLSDQKLGIRWDVHPRTIKRRRRAGKFPPPDAVINGRPYTWLSTVQEHERGLARQAATAA